MIPYPEIDPVIFSIGSLQVRWYGTMYLIGFTLAWLLARYRAKRPDSVWTAREVDDFITFSVVGIILGGRLGYALFYDLPHFAQHPLDIVKVWKGGMSFHGAVLGIISSSYLFNFKYRKRPSQIGEMMVFLAPPGLFFGRLGNFINGELWGKVTDLPWGMVFPNAGPDPRHPSQLYEALFEGLFLFLILWWFTAKKQPRWAATGIFLVWYGASRFLIEFARVPDAQLGYLAFGWVTMGQILCLPMILFGIRCLAVAYGPGMRELEQERTEHE